MQRNLDHIRSHESGLKNSLNSSKQMGGFKKECEGVTRVQTSNEAGTVTVSGKLNVDVPPRTLNSALREADLTIARQIQ